MIALLRHGTLPRDVHGAMKFWRLKEEFKSGFPTSTHWSIRLWIDHLKTGRGHKKRFQFCVNSIGTQILTSELSKVTPEKMLWIRLCCTRC